MIATTNTYKHPQLNMNLFHKKHCPFDVTKKNFYYLIYRVIFSVVSFLCYDSQNVHTFAYYFVGNKEFNKMYEYSVKYINHWNHMRWNHKKYTIKHKYVKNCATITQLFKWRNYSQIFNKIFICDFWKDLLMSWTHGTVVCDLNVILQKFLSELFLFSKVAP